MCRKNTIKGMCKFVGKTTLALVLAASLVFPGSISRKAQASETTEGENDAVQSTADEILNADKYEPSEYDEYSQVEVYGNSDTPFLLSEQNELFLYDTKTNSSSKSIDAKGIWYNNCDMEIQSVSDDGYYRVNSINRVKSGENSVKIKASGYSYVQGIGFDPLGTGRKEYAGYVGYKDKYLYCFVIDPKTGDEKSIQLNAMNWVDEKKQDYYVMTNVFSITAGDFDGDHKDSLLVFGCGDLDDQKIYEIKFDGKNLTKKEVFDITKVVPNAFYADLKNKNNIKYRLQVTLTSGDFDGDGKEEFAFTAGYGNI